MLMSSYNSHYCWRAVARQLSILYNSDIWPKSVGCKIVDLRSRVLSLYPAFSSPEAALLLVSTKNHDIVVIKSMDCNIEEANGKGINVFIERYSPLIVNQRWEIFPNIIQISAR